MIAIGAKAELTASAGDAFEQLSAFSKQPRVDNRFFWIRPEK
jgi:hypothetical protein